MVSIRIHGGAGEIGGNKILVNTKETKVFLDFGTSFTTKRKFYGGFIKAKRFRILEEYILTGMLPELPGIYREDLIGSLDHLRSSEPSVDACIITHAHLDHCGHVSLLRPDIKFYVGATAAILLEVREEIKTNREPEDQIIRVKDYRDERVLKRQMETFSTGKQINIGDIHTTPIHVDHSTPSSYGLVLELNNLRVVYTGDFRLHGPMRKMTEDFIEYASADDVDVLIIEGTRIGDPSFHSEESVLLNMKNFLKDAHGKTAAALIGLLDFDRLKSLISAAEYVGRKLALSPKLAYVINHLEKRATNIQVPKLTGDMLSVYLEPSSSGGYEPEKHYRGWLRSFIQECQDAGVHLVTPEELAEQKDKYVLTLCQSEDLPELVSIRPEPGSIFLFSSSEPHNEEQEIEREKVVNWLELFGMRPIYAHASGHASQGEIISTIERMSPKMIIPVHTECPEMFRSLIEARGIGSKVIEPSRFHEIII
ncbi:MAG: MBL fold metallo-hydrolase [Nitrososphaerota archaeon]|nr:MBL fold metallo-hydrolase [Aigarchaeota archaeon]MDW8076213.1 MBL fold metallo-hydrolase [Nitrososphaerota archaeon]